MIEFVSNFAHTERPLTAEALGNRNGSYGALAPPSLKLGKFGNVKESIINGDDREPVIETTEMPWRAICALTLNFRGGRTEYGTGWLAGPRLVATCGHNVFDRRDGLGWVQSIKVTPGLRDLQEPFGSVTATRFSAPREWEQTGVEAADLGAIHLGTTLGGAIGWLPYGITNEASANGLAVKVCGYSKFAGSNKLQLSADGIAQAAQGRLFYTADTDGGASGAPVWAVPPGANGARVIAVHAYDVSSNVQGIDGKNNSGALLSGAMTELISRWSQVE